MEVGRIGHRCLQCSHSNKSHSIRMMMDNKKEKQKLFDRFDWAALGIAACGVVLLIAIITGNY